MFNILLFTASWVTCGYMTLRHLPVFSFVLYQLVYFYNPSIRWWSYALPSLSYSFITVIFMAISYVIFKQRLQSQKLLANPSYKWLVGLVICHWLVSFHPIFPIVHSEYTTNFLKLVVIVSIAYKLIFNEKSLEWALYGYVLGCSYIGIVAYQTGRNSGDRLEGIGTVDASESNTLACALVPSLVLCLHYFWKNSNIPKYIPVILGGLIANSIILINSRGAFLGAAACIIFYFYSAYKNPFTVTFNTKKLQFIKKRWKRAQVLILLLLGIGAFFTIVDTSFLDRIQSIQNAQVDTNKESGSTRVLFWDAAIDMFLDNPLGVGARGFEFYADAYLPQDLNTGQHRSRAVHSTWFEMLTELGALGFICFIMMLFTAYRSLNKLINHFKSENDEERYYKIIAIKAGLIGFLVTATFINRGRAEVLYWLMLFIMSAFNVYLVRGNYEKIAKENEAIKSDNTDES